MSYDLNSFIKYDSQRRTSARALIYAGTSTAVKLVNHLKNRGVNFIHVADCIAQDASRLPMPAFLLEEIDKVASHIAGPCAIIGLSAYLSLLEQQQIGIFLAELQSRLENDRTPLDYLLLQNPSITFVPRLQESRKVIILQGEAEIRAPFEVSIYPRQWARAGAPLSYSELLQKIDPFVPQGTHELFLPEPVPGQRTFSPNVKLINNIRGIAKKLFGIECSLDDRILELLLEKAIRADKSPDSFLTECFGSENCNTADALKRMLEMEKDELWPAYVDLLKKRLPGDSYMARVLDRDDLTPENLLKNYAVNNSLAVLSESRAMEYANERANALKKIGQHLPLEALLANFISSAKGKADALHFLNCGTISEKTEICRRLAAVNLASGLPLAYARLYPVLADYLADYDWGQPELGAYFLDYRRLRIADSLTEAFAERAFNSEIPSAIPARDDLLANLRQQPDCGLLLVDALGVEYLPAIIAMARRLDLHVEAHYVSRANMPTTTAFNQIEWPAMRTLPAVRGLDNVVHDGAEKHETVSPERSFVCSLEKLEKDVMRRVVEGLESFDRVVLTADHGSSRLALIAHRDGSMRTLPWNGEYGKEALDWRYSTALAGSKCPDECVSCYNPQNGQSYWMVRGYNRLPKKGGKNYALHGGASLEEILVPVLVFSSNARAAWEDAQAATKKGPVELKDELEGLI